MKTTFFFFSLLVIIIAGCSNTENNKKIIGNWAGTEWLVNDAPSSLKPEEAFFMFDNNGKYSFEYAGNKEVGTYKVENDMLFTKPENQQEIMVKIFKLTTDSLVFDMNRSGANERLTLRKNK